MKKIYLLLILFSIVLVGSGQDRTNVFETFDGLSESSYGNYDYNGFHIENGLCNSTNARSGNAVRLRNATSYLEYNDDGNGKDGGVGTISFWYRSWDTSPAAMYDVKVNIDGGGWSNIGSQINTTSTTYSEWSYDLNDASDNILIKVERVSGERLHIDDFSIDDYSSGGPDNPTAFTATPSSTSQIDLSWTQNGNSDDVMVAYTTDGVFGTPVDGTTYSTGNTITGGGEVIYNGSATTYNHTGLTANTQYYYKAWSVDATPNYSSGVSNDTTTLAEEPTADPTSFTATTNSASEITLTWTDAIPAADNYLLKGSSVTYGSIADPVDGITEVNSSLVQNVVSGIQSHQFIGLTPNTTYYFQIYPYNGDNGSVNYKIDNPAQTTGTTDNANTDLIISEVTDPKDTYQAKFVEIYNLSASSIDFSTEVWYISRQANGGTWADVQLTSSIVAGGKYVVAYSQSSFNTAYNFDPNLAHGDISGNGDDGYFLYYGGDHSTGTLIDSYGVIDEDGTGKTWEYTDTKAVRFRSVSSPNTTWTASEWDIPSSANVADMTPSEYREDVSWQAAAVGTDWNTKSTDNWGGTYGYIPDASFNVTIVSASPNDPMIGAVSVCNNLTLNSDAALSVGVAGDLTVYGDLSIAATKDRAAASLVIDSDATGNGSLIVKGSASGSAVVQRYFEAYTGAGDGWHYIGSPVNDMAIASSDFDPTGTQNDLYAWDEDDYLWRNYKGSYFPGTTLANGTGYMVAYQSNVTNSFVGSLNTTDVTFSNLSRTPTKGDGWHLLGNPFASAIYWNDGNWALTNVAGNAKVYDESAGNYVDKPANDIIPSTNGFFIQVSVDGSNSLTIPAASRVHDASGNYKQGRTNNMDETLKLIVNNDANGFSDRTIIGFRDDAQTAFDWDFDSHKMFGQVTAPQLWTLTEGEEFSTNNLPHVYESLALPMNFKAGVNSTYHIIAEGIESFYLNSEIYLEDLQTGSMIDLREQPMYTFEGKPSDNNDRFVLHFFGVTIVSDISLSENAEVYAYANRVFVRAREQNINYKIEVFDLLGRKVFADEFNSNGLNSFTVNVQQGVYLVRLQTGNSVVVNKISLN